MSPHASETTHSASARRPRRWWWLAGAAVLLLAAVWGVQRWRGPQVPAVQVQAQALVRSLQFSARVETRSRVGVGSTIVGRVERVAVQEGDQVQAGQLLVQLEPTELQASVQQAQASLAQARAQLANVRTNGRIGKQSQVAQAQATLQQAQSDWSRNQQLVQQGFLSQASLDEKRKALGVAQAQLQAAQAQAQAAAEGGAELQAAEAQVQQAQSALAAAQAKLQQTHIVAPSAAKVLARTVEPGQIVQAGTALLQLALEGPTLIVAQVDERFLDQLREGQSAQVVADAFADQRLAARVVSIAPGVDAQRGAVEVKLALRAAPPDFLREDMSLSVQVETGRQAQALVLPLQALQGLREGHSAAQVLVLQDGRATPRPVQVGLRTLEAAEIVDGLHAGDTVLLPPAQAGQRVRAAAPQQER
ncbi:efflux RND transporter periplasmic adaptor subunit [Comamonas aquatica]|uniref:efflux RND transporter periplasmic adaptor subunit n=2 Tax=Comamonas aquatica TaxID=225991 RepID=UPI002447F943|nr:efflux RND transporter periplasmic adaptor subunit [Comamonas aquatica]MDH0380883.1 efflux RND transporter periplasmic adaptor subunit [Comamonas aquatica]MDH0429399.1 efflux RND transporter periplasmic adaptor subunit [Comamonas aquatica]MDH0494557.1 efflux RND transporter periplasmic adaptor subunit [Comamonas aquatica]MDH0940519.1 efflux RND transporter periplasmic adaptor subunit [Comamonas aquatica]MDH1674223.1 efflux RND transporter periplasmic adaptor subunit [Comamonas aquatica]